MLAANTEGYRAVLAEDREVELAAATRGESWRAAGGRPRACVLNGISVCPMNRFSVVHNRMATPRGGDQGRGAAAAAREVVWPGRLVLLRLSKRHSDAFIAPQ